MVFHSVYISAPRLFDTILPILSSSVSLGGAIFLLYLAAGQLSQYLNPLRKLPYPPGPPPRDFILGNARDLLTSPLWFRLTEWAAIYGPITHLEFLDKHIIVVNSVDDAVELMERRSNNYSDRPYIPMLELAGGAFATPLKPYQGPTWRAHRRFYQQMFRPSASLKYRPTQTEKVSDLLCSLLYSPEDFITHIKTLSVGVIMSIMYGYKVLPKDDHFQERAEEAGHALTKLTYPSSAIVNVLPFLRFLPTWFPGTGFHDVAREAKEKVDRMLDFPYKYVQDNLAAGTASPSIVASLIETCNTEEDHMLLKEISGTGYAAAAETTSSAITTFIYAMAKFPDVQKKAQEELDRVISPDRLVNYDDEASLPYIQAICREVFRWRPTVPLGIFHATSAEDVYNGYYIPAGTTIIPNVWAMTRDPLKYPDPEEFNPDRFFDESNKINSDDMTYMFGFGRRICPGRHLATDTVWLTVATILSTFDIRPPKDASGREIDLNVEYTGDLASQPHPFECIIFPRSNQTKQIVVDIRNSSI